MTADRRIFSPVTATVMGAVLVGAATLGGTFAADQVAQKTDRFETLGDTLCEGQSWPNLTPECLAWAEGEPLPGTVRFVTTASTNAEAQVTVLTRTPVMPGN